MRRFPLLALGAVFISSCATDGTDAERAFVPLGFLCAASPSTAYSPGYIFRKDERGSTFLVADARDRATTSNYEAAFGTSNVSLVTGGGLSFSLTSVEAPISGKLGASSVENSKMVFNDGRFAFMSDADEVKFIQETKGTISVRPGSRYFFVRDTIQSRGFEIHLSSVDEADLGGEVAIKNLISFNSNLSLERKKSLDVVNKSKTLLNVCVRAIEISVATLTDGPVPVIEGAEPAGRRYLAPADLQRALESL